LHQKEQQLLTINNVVIVAVGSKKPLHSAATILCLEGCPEVQQLMHHSAVNVYNPCMHSGMLAVLHMCRNGCDTRQQIGMLCAMPH